MALNRARSLLITVLFLVAAGACYGVGLVLPGIAFLVAGAAAELIFWIRVFRQR